MNVCKFYKREKNGTVTVLRIRVTQTHAAIQARDDKKLRKNKHRLTVAEARRYAAGKGFTQRRRRADRQMPEAA